MRGVGVQWVQGRLNIEPTEQGARQGREQAKGCWCCIVVKWWCQCEKVDHCGNFRVSMVLGKECVWESRVLIEVHFNIPYLHLHLLSHVIPVVYGLYFEYLYYILVSFPEYTKFLSCSCSLECWKLWLPSNNPQNGISFIRSWNENLLPKRSEKGGFFSICKGWINGMNSSQSLSPVHPTPNSSHRWI